MKQCYLLFVVLVGATILGMRSGIADGVLALGYAKGGPIYGWAAGFSKGSADASTHALNECRGKCRHRGDAGANGGNDGRLDQGSRRHYRGLARYDRRRLGGEMSD